MSANIIPLVLDGLSLALWHYPSTTAKKRALFLHGYFDTAGSFESVITELGDDLECFALDFRGHGYSDKVGTGGSYHFLDYVKDGACALQSLTKEAPLDLLVGHSMGAVVALMLAASLPTTLKRLVMLDNLGGFAEEASEQPERLSQYLSQFMQEKRPLSTPQSLEEAALKVQSNNPGMSLAGATRMAKGMLRQDDRGLSYRFDKRLKGPSPLAFSEDFWRAFCAAVEVPTTLIRAENGYVADGAPALERAPYFKNLELYTIEKVGHHLHVEAPHEVAELIKALVTRS